MNEKLPNWNLDTIYPGIKSKELIADLSRVKELSEKIISSLNSSTLHELLLMFNELNALAQNLDSYSLALISTDSTNEEYLQLQAKIEEVLLFKDECDTRFAMEVKNRESEIQSEENKEYRFVLEEMKTEAEYQMSLKEEMLASNLNRSGGDAFSRLQDSLCANIEKDGETLIALRAKAQSSDRKERERAFYKEKALLKEHEVAYSFALNGVKGTVLSLEKCRGWKSPLERSAFCSRISMKALNALISTLEEALPMWRDYLNTKAQILGLKKLSFYDLFAPVGKVEKEYSFEEAKHLVVNCYSEFSPKMGQFAQKAFDDNWIDAPLYKGKVGGAYDTCFFKSKQSRVLCNFDHSYDAVSTLAHELGHAYHDSVVLELPCLLADYPMPVAETASIFGETLLFQYMKKGMDKAELLPILESTLSGGCQVCVDILSRFYFEQSAFEARKEGDVSPARFSALMLEAQERTYGDAMENKHEYMWAVKSHYYSTDFSFYNYPYAFGQLFALALYSSNINCEDYVKLLRNTGCMSVDDVALSAGFDITDKAFWRSGLEVFAQYLKMMKECAL